SQLNTLRIGQPVTLTADVYGSTVAFHGAIDGLGAGTGAAFALLPAQNATGNWIKVVQRIPVRIRLDPKELAEHPLRVGLSMQVRVDVSRAVGPALSDASSKSRTRVMQGDGSAAQARVRHIIEANGAGGVAHERARGMPSKAIAPAVAPDEAIAAATLAGAASTQPAARLK
ncbi:MAG: HlyD family secretion protein, partial [Burkholderiaceae bacterium]